jgi:plasmid stabilization system protein ParE
MARLVVAGPARLDVREILINLSQVAGIAVTRRYGARFKAMYRYIAQYPAAGAPRPALGQHARIRVVQPFVIIYDYSENDMTILRVVDGRRQITPELLAR